MIENIEVFINNSIRIRDRIGTIYIDPYEMQEVPHDADHVLHLGKQDSIISVSI